MRRSKTGLILVLICLLGLMYLHSHPEAINKVPSVEQTVTGVVNNRAEIYNKYMDFSNKAEAKITAFMSSLGYNAQSSEQATPSEPEAVQNTDNSSNEGEEYFEPLIGEPLIDVITGGAEPTGDENNNDNEVTIEENDTPTSTSSYLYLEEVSLTSVIDGDTIVVNKDGDNETVRLIGIDTPESVNPDTSKNNEYGDMASEYTKEILKGINTVYLQYDTQDEDIYGRTLAYVWLSNDVDISNMDDITTFMLNAVLVQNGYAKDKAYRPNIAYKYVFTSLCENAQDNNTGLWKYNDFKALW